MINDRWAAIQLWLFACLALMTAAYALLVKGDFGFVDESIYYHIAYHLRHLHAFSVDGIKPTAIRPPGYPLVLAMLQLLSESVRFAKLCNLMLWPLCGLLAASIAGTLFGRVARSFALFLCVIYVIELYIAGTLYPQTLCSFLLLLSLWMHLVWRRSGDLVESVLQGLLWSVMVAAVPVFLVNLMVYAAWLTLIKRRIMQSVILLVMVAVPCAGWIARNAEVMHGPFLADNTGEMLLYGNSDLTGPNTGPQVPIWLIAPEGVRQHDELAEENIYKVTAVKWIRAHPHRAAMLYLEKFANWFNYRLNLKTANDRSGVYQLLIAVVYYPILAICLLTPWLLRGSRKLEMYFAVQYLIAAATYAIFFTRIRYRLPYDYLVVILAAGGCAAIIELLNAKGPSATRFLRIYRGADSPASHEVGILNRTGRKAFHAANL